MKTRYDNLKATIDSFDTGDRSVLRFLEVGTFDGKRAADLARHWHGKGKDFLFRYVGFDMFDKMTKEMSKAEFSKSTLPPSRHVVWERINATGATVLLYPGNTKETLPRFVEKRPLGVSFFDIIFIDGGHSLDTIQSDWDSCKKMMQPGTVVLFDDYYENRTDYGCKTLIENLIRFPGPGLDGIEYCVELLDPVDRVEHTNLDIRMAKVTLQ